MIARPDNIAILIGGALVAAALWAAAAGGLAACSAAPVKMECREVQLRIDYGDLTADQMRFALQELEACQGRAREAEKKDSALIEGTGQRFTPADP